jgi:hypothetical protein
MISACGRVGALGEEAMATHSTTRFTALVQAVLTINLLLKAGLSNSITAPIGQLLARSFSH